MFEWVIYIFSGTNREQLRIWLNQYWYWHMVDICNYTVLHRAKLLSWRYIASYSRFCRVTYMWKKIADCVFTRYIILCYKYKIMLRSSCVNQLEGPGHVLHSLGKLGVFLRCHFHGYTPHVDFYSLKWIFLFTM